MVVAAWYYGDAFLQKARGIECSAVGNKLLTIQRKIEQELKWFTSKRMLE